MKKGYALSEIAGITGGSVFGNGEINVTELVTDSRRVVMAEYALFIALRGPNHDGHQYIHSVFAQGVRAFLVEKLPEDAGDFKDCGFVIVRNSLKALQQIAAYHRRKFHYPVIAITGSNGKTMIKEWLASLLSGSKKVVRSPGSYNSQLGVPLSLWLMEQDVDMAIIEAGISLPGEMKHLESMIQPDIGVFTNLGDAHQENFASLQQKLEEKLTLFIHSKILITSREDNIHFPYIKVFCEKNHIPLYTWGRYTDNAVRLLDTRKENGKTTLKIRHEEEIKTFSIPFTDPASIENSMHTLAVLFYLGLDSEKLLHQFAGLQPLAMRMELREGIHQCLLINDFYNSDYHSLTLALGFLKQQTSNGKHTLILSDILQSGKTDDILYREVATLVREQQVDRMIGIGERISGYRNLFDGDSAFFDSTESYLQQFREEDFKDEIVLLKGARKFHFEDISARLEKQVHKTLLEVNLNALAENLNVYKQQLNPDTGIMAMVKALSYGSGDYEIAQTLALQQVDYLAVAYPDEGITLRNAGINTPVLVMNTDISAIRQLVKHNLEPVIYSRSQLAQFHAFFLQEGVVHFPVHVKLDTGMHRLGFLPDESEWVGRQFEQRKTMYVRSIFSHLAASDKPEHDGFTREQIKLFRESATLLMKYLPYKPLLHILNTAGIERFPEAQFDMVRLGLGLYGISQRYGRKLRTVSTFKSIITQVKQVKSGETIGYDRMEKAEKNLTIAVIPVGYADGLPVQLGNRNGALVIGGHRVPLLGKICMDMCMVDITGFNIAEGDEVEIFGPQLAVTEISKLAGTTPYDVLTGISSRVKRNYIHE